MENPAHWKPLEVVIDDAIADYNDLIQQGHYTISLTAMIAREIRERGLIDDRDALPIGWPELIRHHDERERKRVRGRQAEATAGSGVEERASEQGGPQADRPDHGTAQGHNPERASGTG